MLRTPSCVTTVPLIDGWNFGGKREKAGNGRVMGDKESDTVNGEGEGERGREEGESTSGLISQQCDLFALYWHKEPTLLCHYVTKKGVIAQWGPPVSPCTSNPWRRMAYGYGYIARPSSSFPIHHDPPRAPANTPVIFSPFRISLYYFLPSIFSSRHRCQWRIPLVGGKGS